MVCISQSPRKSYIVLSDVISQKFVCVETGRSELEEARPVYSTITTSIEGGIHLSNQHETRVLLHWEEDEFGYNVLYRDELCLHICSPSVLSTYPQWWCPNVIWPPDIISFAEFTSCVHEKAHVIDCASRRRRHTRKSPSWRDAFVFKNGAFYLVSENRQTLLLRLKGLYDLVSLFDQCRPCKIKRAQKRHSLFREDLEAMWREILRLEECTRLKGVSIRSIWLRCCVEHVNRLILDCEEYMDHMKETERLIARHNIRQDTWGNRLRSRRKDGLPVRS